MKTFDPYLPTWRAQKYVAENLDRGVTCPCCNQLAKRYHRRIPGTALRMLIDFSRDKRPANQYVHCPTRFGIRWKGGGDWAKLRYWGLIEAMPNDDAAKRASGYWRITERGYEALRTNALVPTHVVLYDGKPQAFGDRRERLYTLAKMSFDFSALMAARVQPDLFTQPIKD